MPRRDLIGRNPKIVDVLSESLTPIPESTTGQASPVVQRPIPESELTDEQRRIRELENQLALERGRKDPDQEFETGGLNSSDNIQIHFVDDGFTALGQVWFRGQELEFVPGGQAYKDTCDRRGWSWLSLRDSEAEQIERYGRVMFRSGLWKGKGYSAAIDTGSEASQPKSGKGSLMPTAEELKKAEQLEARRNRAAPRLPLR